MFSHIAGRMPFARQLALFTTLVFASAVERVQSQELNAPFQAPGAMQTPGGIQTPSGFQNPATPADAGSQSLGPVGMQPAEGVVYKIHSPNERMEMTVNSSRILSLGQNIPRALVNNKEVLELTALSPTEIQVSAKKAGVTQINLWNENGKIYTVDCIVYGDARELAELLRSEFPTANLKVRPMQSSVLLTGWMDRSDQVSQVIQIAQDYYPKVVPYIRVGGVQQILLHVKVAEISRTKARSLGFDFAQINGESFFASSVSGLLNAASVAGGFVPSGAGDTVRFAAVDGNHAFFGFLEALRREDILKICSDPTLVTVSGRPAFFNSGGEFPILVPQSLGTVSIEYKKFGTQVDFVPIVLGNGNIRLEVRPRISEIDETRAILINGTTVPGLRVREADTGVEMKPGQTLAIAGLIQTRLQAANRGIPWLMEMPFLGAAFRRTSQREEEVESLILVTPEVVEALDCGETPHCFPGTHTDVPSDCQMFWLGHIEVPSKGPCGPGGCGIPGGVMPAGYNGISPQMNGASPQMYEELSPGTPTPANPPSSSLPTPADTTRNSRNPGRAMSPVNTARLPGGPANANNRYIPSSGQDTRSASGTNRAGGAPGFIGPVGYDVIN